MSDQNSCGCCGCLLLAIALIVLCFLAGLLH